MLDPSLIDFTKPSFFMKFFLFVQLLCTWRCTVALALASRVTIGGDWPILFALQDYGDHHHWQPFSHPIYSTISYKPVVGRDDFRFFWNFITAFQILPCVIETRRYGYIRDSGSRVETPHRATIGCEKFYNGCFHCCGHFWDKYTSALVHNFVCYQNSEIWLYTGLWK